MCNVARIVNIQGRCGNKNIVGPNHYVGPSAVGPIPKQLGTWGSLQTGICQVN